MLKKHSFYYYCMYAYFFPIQSMEESGRTLHRKFILHKLSFQFSQHLELLHYKDTEL